MMKRIRSTLTLLIIFVCLSNNLKVAAQNAPINIDLWPNGAPNSNGFDQQEEDESQGIYKPTMRIFLPAPEKATGRAIIVLPGGGYGRLAYNHEGYDFAPFFEKMGIACIVLKYRMPKGLPEIPFSDVKEAMRIVKEHADQWHINPKEIGIMGSSAGGHLASTFATKASENYRPSFQILLYPVISMEQQITHAGSRSNLLGKNQTQAMIDLYSTDKRVTPKTPPTFIALSDDDKGVVPQNSINYYLALHKNNIPVSMHIYPTGGHGWGYRDSFKYHFEFMDMLESWIRSLPASSGR